MNLTPLDPNIFFSIVIPCYNESGNIETTLTEITKHLSDKKVEDYEIVVVNDNSTDNTEEILKWFSENDQRIRYVNNSPPNGFGFAVRKGLSEFKGQAVCIVMADLSDSPEDIYKYYRELKAGHECVFGSRFIKGGKVHDYPKHKYFLNRIANYTMKVLFGIPHNDITNAFKAYRREVIEGVMPLISYHFNLTIEIPLKAIVRGYTFKTVPITWTNRVVGVSNLRIEEMGSRYLFIMLYVFLEKLLSKGDYMRKMKVVENKVVEVEEDKKAS